MSKYMKQLQKMEGAVDWAYDFYKKENVLRSTSVGLNWIYGKGSGLPFGFGTLLYGKPKSGKSLATNLMIAGLHAQDPTAEVVKFDTEMREDGDIDPHWGIDKDRYHAFNTNQPEDIFDRIVNEFVPMLEDGWPLKLLIIDSIQGVEGVKEGNSDSISNHLMGDHALTIGKGLKRILPIIRKYKIAVVCCEHIRGNLDAGQYGPKEKMAGGWAEKHFFEYYVEVSRDGSAEGKESLTGEKFENDKITDFKGNKEKTARKIFIKMVDNTKSIAGRACKVTLAYDGGLINTEEEIFELAKNLNLVERPNNRTYIMGEQQFSSKGDFITAIKEQETLRNQLVTAIYKRDRP
jgi:hypothetical protein